MVSSSYYILLEPLQQTKKSALDTVGHTGQIYRIDKVQSASYLETNTYNAVTTTTNEERDTETISDTISLRLHPYKSESVPR